MWHKPTHIFLTEFIQPDDPRDSCVEMKFATDKEVQGIMNRDTFKTVQKTSLPKKPMRFLEDLYWPIKRPSTENATKLAL